MHLSLGNFLTQIKNIITGGGRADDGSALHDSGFLKDINLPLNTLSTQAAITDSTGGTAAATFAAITAPAANATTSLTADMTAVKNALAEIAARFNALNLEASETNLLVQSFAASTTAAGTFSIVVPRDYDEATDTFTIKLGAASAGSTDKQSLTASGYYKRPGKSVATLSASVTGKDITGKTTVNMSSAEQVVYFSFSGLGLKRDDAVTITLTSAAHTTDALLVYFVEPVYRSTLVSYDETDDATNKITQGNNLR